MSRDVAQAGRRRACGGDAPYSFLDGGGQFSLTAGAAPRAPALTWSRLPGGPGTPPLRHHDRGARSLLKRWAKACREARPGVDGEQACAGRTPSERHRNQACADCVNLSAPVRREAAASGNGGSNIRNGPASVGAPSPSLSYLKEGERTEGDPGASKNTGDESRRHSGTAEGRTRNPDTRSRSASGFRVRA